MLQETRLDIAEARVLIEGARLSAAELGVPMCIAVADSSGLLIAFERMDDAKVSSIDIAINKAFTAAAARGTTEKYNQLCVPGQPTFGIHLTNGGRFCVIGGGVPVILEERVVGAIGISAGTAAQDIVCAESAVRHFHTWNETRNEDGS